MFTDYLKLILKTSTYLMQVILNLFLFASESKFSQQDYASPTITVNEIKQSLDGTKLQNSQKYRKHSETNT